MARTTVIGLTGSVGMGKSTVAQMLRDMGVPVHDADAAVHALTGPGGAAVEAVGAAFPETVARDENGAPFIDRRALGRIIFAHAGNRRALEDILHPLVRAESDAFRARMEEEGHAVIALDIPLLFETGGEKRVDVTVCVSAPPQVQRARALARPGMTPERFGRILESQMPDAEKRARADYVIDNGGAPQDTRAQVERMLASIRAGAESR